MQVRRKDEEFINSLRLLGAGVGAILAVLAVCNTYNRQNNKLSEQRALVRQNAPFLALAGLQQAVEQDNDKAANVVGELLENISPAKAELARMENTFWTTLPLLALTGLCASAAVGGLVTGYCSVWMLSWIATIATIKFIRSTYKLIWRIKPQFDGGKQIHTDDEKIPRIKRDEHRILPGVVKMCVMALIGLIIFAIAVYYLTG
jgi:hypothetical protein